MISSNQGVEPQKRSHSLQLATGIFKNGASGRDPMLRGF
jgi:hypothetical protein